MSQRVDDFLNTINNGDDNGRTPSIRLDEESAAAVEHWKRLAPRRSRREILCSLVNLGHVVALERQKARSNDQHVGYAKTSGASGEKPKMEKTARS